jgi:hypothetical protein
LAKYRNVVNEKHWLYSDPWALHQLERTVVNPKNLRQEHLLLLFFSLIFLAKTFGQCKYAFFKKRRNKTDRLTLLGTLEEEEATALQEWPTSFLPTL